MKRRAVLGGLTLGIGTLVVGCATESSHQSNSTKKVSLDADADLALSQLYSKIGGSKELLGKAKGALIFPRVITAGVVIGGSFGEGVLRSEGKTTGYYSASSASIGLLAGAASKSMFVLFMTEEALYQFTASSGWTAGADASVALLASGADGQLDTTTAKASVIGLVIANGGLMANLSIEGTKVQRLFI